MLLLQGWAYGGSLLSMWASGRKSLWGPALGALGTVPWVIIGLCTGLPLLVVFDIIVGGLYLRQLYLWQKGERHR